MIQSENEEKKLIFEISLSKMIDSGNRVGHD